MDWSHLTLLSGAVLILVLAAETSNGWTDAPTGTSAAVASAVLTSKAALWVTAVFNFVGLIAALYMGAAVAKTIGTGIVRPDVISIASIGIAMITIVAWAAVAAWLGLPVSKTHSLLAALAGIGYAQGGFDALLPASRALSDSGWFSAGKGVLFAIACGSAMSWFLTGVVIKSGLHVALTERWWKWAQRLTVCIVASGHGFNDGLKYVGIFTLVLYKSAIIPEFHVLPEVIVLCAFVMGAGTLFAGWRIHRRLDTMVNGQPEEGRQALGERKRSFRPHMGVCAELTSGFAIWQTGWLGIPMSTNHAVVSAMAGARSASGKVHISSVIKILWGWVVTYVFCFFGAELMTTWFL